MNRLKAFAVIFASVWGAGSASAVATLAAWDNDFSVLKKDGVTLDLQDNTVQNGVITIGAKGLKLSRTGQFGPANKVLSSNACITVIMEVSDIPTTGTNAICHVGISSDNYGGATIARDGYLYTSWCNKSKMSFTLSSSKLTLPTSWSGTKILHFRYQNRKGSRVALDGTVVSDTNYSSDSRLGSNVLIGEYVNNTYVATGLKIRKIAVVCGAMSDNEVAAYVWPSERYSRFKEYFGGRIWSIQGGSALSSSATFSQFDPTNGYDIGTTFLGNSKKVLPGTSTENFVWNAVCSGVAGYKSPGIVLRVPPFTSSPLSAYGDFNPVSLGGIIVEAGASTADAWAKITRYGDSRPTELGDK